MKKKVFAVSIIMNLVFLSLLIVLSFKYQEELFQKYIGWNGKAEIVMFGDSHTALGKWNSTLDKSPVLRLGWSRYTSDMLVGYIHQAISFQPKYVFILCGGNDLYSKRFSVENTVQNFKEMATILKNENITPVFQKLIYQHENPQFNKTIDSINSRLEEYCIKEQIEIIDISKKMYDSSGLKASLTGDNLHLNKAGYKIWSEAINAYLLDKY